MKMSLKHISEILEEMNEFEPEPYGTCCVCGCEDGTVTNFLMLDVKAPVPGTGWGCVICGTPSDGALAALCDQCARNPNPPIKEVINGYIKDCQRISIDECCEKFEGHKFEHD